MRHVRGRLWSATRVLAFGACAVLCAPPAGAAQTADEAAVRALVEKFFAAYQREDLEGLSALWSQESPDLAAHRQAMERTFADQEKIEVRGLSVGELKVSGDKASARVSFEAASGRPAAGFVKTSRTLHFVKAGEGWKVWRYVSAEQELAAELAAAATAENRRALLGGRPELQNAELVGELLRHGRTLMAQGEFERASDLVSISLSVAERVGDRPGVATALRLTGNVHASRGDNVEALEYYRKSRKLSEELGDKPGVAGSLNNSGSVLDSLGDYVRALEDYQRGLVIATEIKHQHLVTLLLNNIGLIYRKQGDIMLALDYLQRSQKIAEASGDRAALSLSLLNIGAIHSSQGNYPQALEYYQKSLAIQEELGAKWAIPRILGNIGLAHTYQRNYPLALEFHQKTLKMAEELGDKEVIAGSLNNIGNVYEAQGDYPRALEYFRKSLELAEAMGNKVIVADSWRDLAETYYLTGEYRKAIEHAERASALSLEGDMPDFYWWARTVVGKSRLALGEGEAARQPLLDAISTVEELRWRVVGGEQERQRFFETKVAPYYAMVELLLSQGDDFQALAYAERAKGRVLHDVLSNGRVNIIKAMTAEEQRRERALNEEISALNTRIYRERQQTRPDAARLADLDARLRRARLEYESFLTSLYVAHPELKVRRGEPPPLTREQVEALLPDSKAALLEFVVADQGVRLFVVTRAEGARGGLELKTYRLGVKSEELAALVADFRGRLAERNLEFQEVARRLYDLLLRPASAQLRRKTLLAVVPDGVLWELPFQALRPSEDAYLIESAALFYAPSLGVLHAMRGLPGAGAARQSRPRPSTRGHSDLLAFGNPALGREVVERVRAVHRDEKLGPLPEAEREVNMLRELYGPSRSRVYVGAQAREGLAKAEVGDYRVVHFATHGILDDQNPMYSHVLLSQAEEGRGEDGLLHAWEIMNLDLRAEMVVLSACQTGRGRVGAGEGIVGMSWALFVAGSPRTVVSHWKVESSSTTRLMVEFHRALLAAGARPGGRSAKADALRAAGLALLNDSRYRHPFYWAGFAMVGDGL